MTAVSPRPTRLGLRQLRWVGWAAVAALIATALLAPASAFSSVGTGNNGTVKIHDGATETEPLVQNEPHVCTFHLHFFFADPSQAGVWEIQQWSPDDKGQVVLSGAYDTSGSGEDRQPEEGVFQLPAGHYKLFWGGDTDKHDKMKVFWVTCAAASSAPSFESSQVPGSETPSEVASEVPSEVPSAAASNAPSLAPTEQPSFGGGVGGVTNPPFGSGELPTLPNTATALAPATPSDDTSWRIVLMGLAGILAAVLLLPERAYRRT